MKNFISTLNSFLLKVISSRSEGEVQRYAAFFHHNYHIEIGIKSIPDKDLRQSVPAKLSSS